MTVVIMNAKRQTTMISPRKLSFLFFFTFLFSFNYHEKVMQWQYI